MKISDLSKLIISPTLFHEYCHARALKDSNQRVYVVQGISDKERGVKLPESYFADSADYINKEICGFPYYKHIESTSRIQSLGRADVDERIHLVDELVVKSLGAPRLVGLYVVVISVILLFLIGTFSFLTSNHWCLIFLILLIWPLMHGIFTAALSYDGVKRDVDLLKHPQEFKNIKNFQQYLSIKSRAR